MEIVNTISEVRERVRNARNNNKRIGFVPTMGYLHKGHISLVEISKQHTDYQVMSIFVNRIQFNDISDFNTYPKDLERDFTLAKNAGVDLVFVPNDEEMYINNLTYVDVDVLTKNLCGAHRPGHFKGVFTVVSKLFNIVQPDVSVFGQKDIQQAVSIEKMVFDLNFPLKIIVAPIVREEDGLAMSSRNKHLNPENRKNGIVLYKSLKRAEEMLASGERRGQSIISEMKGIINKGNPSKIDYISAVAYKDLSPVEDIKEKSVIALAVYFGNTRLIDNMIIDMDNGKIRCIY